MSGFSGFSLCRSRHGPLRKGKIQRDKVRSVQCDVPSWTVIGIGGSYDTQRTTETHESTSPLPPLLSIYDLYVYVYLTNTHNTCTSLHHHRQSSHKIESRSRAKQRNNNLPTHSHLFLFSKSKNVYNETIQHACHHTKRRFHHNVKHTHTHTYTRTHSFSQMVFLTRTLRTTY